jgi:hypothetical protein
MRRHARVYTNEKFHERFDTKAMKTILRALALITILGTGLSSCTVKESDTPKPIDTARKGEIIEQPAPPDTTAALRPDSLQAPITLPVLDAFFADSTFAADLKSRLGLTDSQIDSLRALARSSIDSLHEYDSGEYSGTTAAARTLAEQRVGQVIGSDKSAQLFTLLRQRWNYGTDSLSAAAADSNARGRRPNAVPTDTRIVVNAPAYRMDLYQQGRLVRSFKIGIGYPEFPLPAGLRSAKTIIFNPSWTPPDESWVASSRRFKAGKTIKAGSGQNPLGIAKIPIGLPSLIHGGKTAASLGGFDSHGCVGLTDAEMREFAPMLADMAGATLTADQIAAYQKDRKQSHSFDLPRTIPVELRYETIVAQDGAIHVYRDVYDYNTNNEMNLRSVLAANGLTMDQLSDAERTQITAALKEMSRNANGTFDSTAVPGDTAAAFPSTGKGPSEAPKSATNPKLTRTVKGRKEIVIPVAALQGKGYPEPVSADSATAAAKPKGKRVM